MKAFHLIASVFFAACAATEIAAPSDEHGTIVFQVTGNDGAAAGQTNTATLTPDHILHCRFVAYSPFDADPIDQTTTFTAKPILYASLSALIVEGASLDTVAPGTDQLRLETADATYVIVPDAEGFFFSDFGNRVQDMIDAAIAPESCFLWG